MKLIIFDGLNNKNKKYINKSLYKNVLFTSRLETCCF